MTKRNGGFSLVEVLVAIVLLGATIVPISTALVTSIKINDKTESMLQAQLDVSSAVEHLMASGITGASVEYDIVDGADMFPEVKISTAQVAEEDGAIAPYYSVTVTSNDDLVTVTTFIRKGGAS